MKLDHIAIAGETLDDATTYVEETLGAKLLPGGEHDVFHTHNRLLGLEDGLYLEVIAINPDAPKPDRPRWFNMDRFKGAARLTNWICRCDDLQREIGVVPLSLGRPVALTRGDLSWRMAVPDNGILPYDNCAPALIEWQSGLHPAHRLPTSGVRLRRLTISHPEGKALEEALCDVFADDRVAIETGNIGYEAVFDTPAGQRRLT